MLPWQMPLSNVARNCKPNLCLHLNSIKRKENSAEGNAPSYGDGKPGTTLARGFEELVAKLLLRKRAWGSGLLRLRAPRLTGREKKRSDGETEREKRGERAKARAVLIDAE